MVWLVGALLLLWVALGPVVLVLAAAAAGGPAGPLVGPGPRLRQPSRRGLDGRDRRDRRPPGRGRPGRLAADPAGPGRVGRSVVRRSPGVAPPGAGRGGPAQPPPLRRRAGQTVPGPLGHQPEVDTAWFGLQRCGRLEQTATGLLVALCAAGEGRALRVVDPQTLRPVASQGPARPARGLALRRRSPSTSTTPNGPWSAPVTARCSRCGRPTRASPTSRPTPPGTSSPTSPMATASSPSHPTGRAASGGPPTPVSSGRSTRRPARSASSTSARTSGTTSPSTQGRRTSSPTRPCTAWSWAATARRRSSWRSEYDGVSGSAPVLVDRGTVAITDEVEDRLGVRFLARDDGRTVCRQSVFDKGEGATRSTLADLGAGVVVANDAGYASSRRALLGFTAGAGVARVDLVDDGCAVTWTTDAVSPASGVVASRPNGLLYAWAKRPSLTGRQRVVPHGDRRRLRSPALGRAHRHRAARRQRRLDGHARPRRLGLPRHAGRAGPGARPPLGPSRRPGEPDRLLAASPTAAAAPPRRAPGVRCRRSAADRRPRRGRSARRTSPPGGRRWPPSGSARRPPRRTATPALTAPSRIGGAPAAGGADLAVDGEVRAGETRVRGQRTDRQCRPGAAAGRARR